MPQLTEEQKKNATVADVYEGVREQLLLLSGRIKAIEDGISGQLENVRQVVDGDIRRKLAEIQDAQIDLLKIKCENHSDTKSAGLRLVTNHPYAVHSDDFKHPRGAKNDNTRHPRFVRKCESVFRRKIRHLDLGCAGGGLVWDFLLEGHESFGIEGSDLPLLEQSGQWRLIRENLGTADITKPFYLRDSEDHPVRFDVITAWEVLEHIPETSLEGFFSNIKENLAPGGYFVGSIATFEDKDPVTGAVYHVTVHPREWWMRRIEAAGMRAVEGMFSHKDFVRGVGNLRAHDWDALSNPGLGFHVVFKRASD